MPGAAIRDEDADNLAALANFQAPPGAGPIYSVARCISWIDLDGGGHPANCRKSSLPHPPVASEADGTDGPSGVHDPEDKNGKNAMPGFCADASAGKRPGSNSGDSPIRPKSERAVRSARPQRAAAR